MAKREVKVIFCFLNSKITKKIHNFHSIGPNATKEALAPSLPKTFRRYQARDQGMHTPRDLTITNKINKQSNLKYGFHICDFDTPIVSFKYLELPSWIFFFIKGYKHNGPITKQISLLPSCMYSIHFCLNMNPGNM